MESNMKTLKIERNSLKSENEYLKNSRNTNPIGAEKNINSNSQTDMGLNTKAHGKRRMNKFYVNKVDLQPTNKHSEGNRDAMKRKSIIYKEFDCKIIKELGRGNFAVTYECKLTNGDTVVLKKATVNADVEQFKQEMMGLFNSQGQVNILKFIGIVETSDGRACFITEFCEQGSLDKLHDKLDLTMDYAFWKIAQGLLLGLIHLHQNQYIHRDIACRNILVTNNGSIRISGYGLAVRASSGIYLSHPEEMLPWPWMAPETLKSPNRKFTTKSDVWAAGVTLWEILNKGKRRPYNCDRSEVPDICEGKAKLVVPNKWRGTDIEAVVHKCLTFEPDKRPSAYEALIYSTPDGYKQVRKFGTKAMIQKSYNWHSLPQKMLCGRTDPGAVLWNDRLYAIGTNLYRGDQTAMESIECFDFKTQEWKMLCTKKSSKGLHCREYFGAVAWKSRLLLVGGDRDQYSKSLEYLDLDDPYAGWKQLTQKMKYAYNRPRVIVSNDKLYVTGRFMGNVECLNLSDEGAGFQELPRRAGSECYGLHVYDNRLYAVSEKNVQCLHLKENKGWYTLPLKMSMRRSPGVATWRHILFVVGGFEIVDSADKNTDSRSWRYHRDSMWVDLRRKVLEWKRIPQRITDIRNFPGAIVHCGTLYVFGGAGEDCFHSEDTMEHLDISSLLQLTSHNKGHDLAIDHSW
eukprot:jgi/Bigna1/144397/aug1.87_g19105